MAQFTALLIITALIVLAFRSLKKPGIAIALVWSMFGIEQVLQANFALFVQQSWLVNVGIGVVCLSSVFVVFAKTSFVNYRMSKQLWFYSILMGICVLSIAWCPDRETTLGQFKENFPQIITFCFLGPLCLYKVSELDNTIRTMTYFGALILFAMLFLGIGSRGFVMNAGNELIEGNSLAASQFAGYVGICAVFSIYSSKSNALHLIFKVAVTLVAMYLIVKSSSRGQLVAFVATCFFWLPIAAKIAAKRSTIIAVVFAFVVIAGGIMSLDESQWSARWEMKHIEAARDGRLMRNIDLIVIYLENGPLTWFAGLGSSASFEVVGGYPHNVPVETLTEEGLIGFCCLALIIGYTFSDALSTMRLKMKVESTDRVNAAVVLALFTYDLMLSMKQGTLLGSVPMFSFAITVGCITVLRKRQKFQKRKKDQFLSMQQQMANAQHHSSNP